MHVCMLCYFLSHNRPDQLMMLIPCELASLSSVLLQLVEDQRCYELQARSFRVSHKQHAVWCSSCSNQGCAALTAGLAAAQLIVRARAP